MPVPIRYQSDVKAVAAAAAVSLRHRRGYRSALAGPAVPAMLPGRFANRASRRVTAAGTMQEMFGGGTRGRAVGRCIRGAIGAFRRRPSGVSIERAAGAMRQATRLFWAVAAGAILALAPPLAAAGPLTQCKHGQHVVYGSGNPGVIAGEYGGECLIRSPDGRFQSWIALGELTPVEPPRRSDEPSAPPAEAKAGEGEETVEAPEVVEPADFYGWPVVLASPRREARRQRHSERPKAAAGGPATTKRGVQPTRAASHPNLRTHTAPALRGQATMPFAPAHPH